jgi:hypothetical protein
MKNKGNHNHIPGLHNYCDRWCERCSFTARCAVYESSSQLTPEQNDMNNKAFWDNLSKNFADTMTMLVEEAAKQGLDLNAIPEEEMKAYEQNEKKQDEQSEKHPLIVAAKLYSNMAMQLLDKNELLKGKGAEMQQQFDLGIKDMNAAKAELAMLNDCYEIVQWYVHQIYVKLKRAMYVYDEGEEEDEFMISGANGSAKVALIGADRCISAWEKIMQFIPAAEDEILDLLALLQKTRVLAEKQFPNARKLVRPGFDTEMVS